MNKFQYTVGGDYNSDKSLDGYYAYNPDTSDKGLVSYGEDINPNPNDPVLIEFLYNKNSGSYFLSERYASSSVYANILSSEDGKVLDATNSGFSFDYSYSWAVDITGGNFGDHFVTWQFNDRINGGGGDDFIEASLGYDYYDGGDGIDTVDYSKNNINNGTGLIIDLNIGFIPQTADSRASKGDILVNIENIIGDPSWRNTLIGNGANNVLTGGAHEDTLDGGAGDDTLTSYSGTDTLTGGDGNDILNAGEGDDKLFGGNGDDILNGGSGSDILDGGSGNNTVSYAGINTFVYVNLQMDYNSDFNGGHDTYINISNVIGGNRYDQIYGDDADNIIEGGPGPDEIIGGGGNNTASYEHSIEGVTVTLGIDYQRSAGDADHDWLSEIQNLTGSGSNDTLQGDGKANVLKGGAGNDILRGMGGADTLDGGSGNDRLVITQAFADANGVSHVLIYGGEDAGGLDVDTLFLQGHDTFKFNSGNFGGIETVYVADGAGLDLTDVTTGLNIISQSKFGDYDAGRRDLNPSHITGTSEADTIIGGKGSDYIYGGGGNDALKGGSLVNSSISTFAELHGGAGNDTLIGVGANTNLYGDAGNDTLRAGSSPSGNPQLYNYLDGGAGDDKLVGSAERDAFVFKQEFGRDNVYKFQIGLDKLDVSDLVNTTGDVNIKHLENGNSIVTFEGSASGNKIIVHGNITQADFMVDAVPAHDGAWMY